MNLKSVKSCSCDRCLRGAYDPASYVVSAEEIRQLDEPRPFGLSGHMVAKNEALTIRESVESVLPVLDELIITYQTSQDGTEEILTQLQDQYPEKLRIFHYKPYLPPYGRLGNKKESNKYPEGSIHNPANYYNFGLVRHRFAYYMKVDGDQVYFTEKLQKIRGELHQVYHQPDWKRGKLAIQFFRKLYWLNTYLMKITPFQLFQLNGSKNRFLFAIAFNSHFAFSMAGLNVQFEEENLNLPVKPLDFNSGVGDHFILPVTSKNIYRWSDKYFYEIFSIPKYIPIGFCWLHFKFIKMAMDGQYREIAVKSESLERCRNLSADELLKMAQSAKESKRNGIRKKLIKHFWDQDRQYIPDLPELTQKVKRFLKEHSRGFGE